MTRMMISDETIELGRNVGDEFREHFKPLIEQWVNEQLARGIDEDAICIGVSAQALVLASGAHIGSNALFMKMARAAIETTLESHAKWTTH